MLTVTEAARSHLSDLLDKAGAPAEAAVRFVRNEQELSLQLDEPQEGDHKYELGERVVLVVDEEVAQVLDGKTLDTTETAEGIKLAVTDNA